MRSVGRVMSLSLSQMFETTWMLNVVKVLCCNNSVVKVLIFENGAIS